MGSLKAKLHGLSGLDAAVPAGWSCRVWVGAAEVGIPTVGDAGCAAVSPIYIPIVDGAAAIVGNADTTGKTRTPVVGDQVTALAARVCRRAGCLA